MTFIYDIAVSLIEKNISFVYITLFKQNGSSPRKKGSKMIITADSIYETIGGGAIENDLIQISRNDLIPNHTSAVKCYDISGKDVLTCEFICGGFNEFVLHYIDYTDQTALHVFKEASSCYQSHKKGFIFTVLNDSNTRVIEFKLCEDSNILSDNKQLTIIDPVIHSSMVYLFGAGHVSKEAAKIFSMTDFCTTVIDDREDFANSKNFPNSDIIILNNFNNINDLNLIIDDNSYIVIMTRGHKYDRLALEWAITTNAYYIGMIGSINKRNTIYDYLIQNGVSKDILEKVHSPIGLSIGAHTPGEIAVSIAAQLIQERARPK